MGNLLRKLIEWSFYKYVVDYHLEGATLEELEGYPLPEDELGPDLLDDDLVIIFEPDEEFVEGLKEVMGCEIEFEFDDEIEQAMHEKKYHTEQ